MSFVLHHTWLGDRSADKLAFVLHGILGSGSNFRSIIKRLAEVRADYAFLLIDLRLHGRSLGAPPPHDLGACIADLERLATHIGRLPTCVIGHSFGGKLALGYAERQPHGLEQTWVLDAYPGAHTPGPNHEVIQVTGALSRVPLVVGSRQHFVDALVEQHLSTGVAHWLSQNLVREGDTYRFRLDLEAIGELLGDYFRKDLWPVVERPPPGQEICLVIAERSQRLNREARERLGELSRHPQVQRHTLANAGHWLHVDNPDGLGRLLAEGLR